MPWAPQIRTRSGYSTNFRWQAITRSIHHCRRSGRGGKSLESRRVRSHLLHMEISVDRRDATRRRPRRTTRRCQARMRAAGRAGPPRPAVPARCRRPNPARWTPRSESRSARRCRAAWRTPPSGATFSTAMSAASARTTCSGSSALRMLSSAAIGTSTRRRSSASSGTVLHGCSMYSSGPSAVSASAAATASSTLQPPFASTRTVGTSARTALTRPTSSANDCPGSATFTFAVRAPGKSGQHLGHLIGGDGGHGGVDRDAVATRCGWRPRRPLRCLRPASARPRAARTRGTHRTRPSRQARRSARPRER